MRATRRKYKDSENMKFRKRVQEVQVYIGPQQSYSTRENDKNVEVDSTPLFSLNSLPATLIITINTWLHIVAFSFKKSAISQQYYSR